MNRRTFFQTALVAVGAVTVFSSLTKAEERRRGGAVAGTSAPALVDPNDALAKSVKYVHDNKEIKDATLQTERSGVKFKDQKCVSCQFYQNKQEVTVGGKKAAPCQMPFATGKVVASAGWCTSWAKKV